VPPPVASLATELAALSGVVAVALREILKRARRQLTTAEVLTGAVERLAGLGWDRDPPRLMREIERELSNCEPPRPPVSAERICRACEAVREYEDRWSRLAAGETLVVQWLLLA
jgi:hypothetical protein